ncbi:unnamed protein product [Lepeophtheirus salmonis]|uniref:(salmon louse) hypothetical protein n=1 Tax=Lepeophtheirus salmonis TaxID=72036 RepID=A0A7R8CAC8_LEPSM|nr:unnamed protein product [Lepeophtheirus salmonis]CAF2749688.1 unnamed protein product [Lepeophtheirus salmonis]
MDPSQLLLQGDINEDDQLDLDPNNSEKSEDTTVSIRSTELQPQNQCNSNAPHLKKGTFLDPADFKFFKSNPKISSNFNHRNSCYLMDKRKMFHPSKIELASDLDSRQTTCRFSDLPTQFLWNLFGDDDWLDGLEGGGMRYSVYVGH